MFNTMFFEGLQSYFGPILTLIVFMVMIGTDKLFSARTKRYFFLEAALIGVLMLATWFDECFSRMSAVSYIWAFRRFTSFLNFGLSPISPLLLDLIYLKDNKRLKKGYFFIPMLFNIVMCLISIPTGIIFGIDEANIYTRGPLFSIPFIVTAFYMIMMVVYAWFQADKPNRRRETALLSVIIVISTSVTILGIVLRKSFMIWTATENCVVLYFLLLTTQKILYDPLTGAFSRVAYAKRLGKIDGTSNCTIAMIDLNDLRQFNNLMGHDAGDEAINSVVTSIRSRKNKSMQLYRIGGDEFVLLDKGLKSAVMEKILSKAQEACTAVKEHQVFFAYGVSEYRVGEDLYDVIKKADEAMYINKEKSKSENIIKSN